MKKIFCIIAFFLSFCVIVPSKLQASNDHTDFSIVKIHQSLSFSIENGKLEAELMTNEIVRCNSKAGGLYRKVVFFDSQSSVEKIEINNRYFNPVITNDFPTHEIFHSDSKMAYVEHRFTAAKRTAEFVTYKTYNDFKLIDLLKFQSGEYEVLDSEITIEIPNWLECEIRKFNFENTNIESKVTEINQNKVYSFRSVNIPAMKDYIAVPDARNFMPHLIVLPAYFTYKDKKHTLLPDVGQLYKWYNGLTKESGNDNQVLKPLVESLTKDKTSREDKIRAIYYYVQDHIKYIAFEHGIMGFKPESCQKVFNDKFGDCKGMANLTKEMLLLVGIDARLTWLGTAGIPYNYDLPSVYADNHMICTVVDGDQYLFLDATEKNNDLGHYADRIQGREVLIQNGDNFIKDRIPVQDQNIHEIKENIRYNIENNVLHGKASLTLRGNAKSHFSSIAQSVSEKNRDETIRKYIAGQDKNVWLKIANIDLPARDRDHVIEYDIKIENQIIDDGHEKYINFEFDNTLVKFVPEKDRNIPMKINHRYFKSYTAQLAIPQGYKLKYIPEKFESENVLGNFAFYYEQKGDKILYYKKLHLTELELLPAHFDEWRNFVKKLKTFYHEQIVLEKQ